MGRREREKRVNNCTRNPLSCEGGREKRKREREENVWGPKGGVYAFCKRQPARIALP